VRESSSFLCARRSSFVFSICLSLERTAGNYLNGGTARGGAYGFKLDTLGKLESVKGADNKTTLLDILAKWAVSDAPSGPAAPMLGVGEVRDDQLVSRHRRGFCSNLCVP
jgi:hypothetical protein